MSQTDEIDLDKPSQRWLVQQLEKHGELSPDDLMKLAASPGGPVFARGTIYNAASELQEREIITIEPQETNTKCRTYRLQDSFHQ